MVFGYMPLSSESLAVGVLRESAGNTESESLPSWSCDDESQDSAEINVSTSASSEDIEPSTVSSELSYFASLALKLRSNNKTNSIRIISDSAATHSHHSRPLSFPSSLLSSIDEYSALDEFMSVLLNEKGFFHSKATIQIVPDNPSSLTTCIPMSSAATSSSSSSQLPLNISCQLPMHSKQEELESDHEVEDRVVEPCAATPHGITRVGRSYSMEMGYSTPKPSKPKRSVARARSFQGTSSSSSSIRHHRHHHRHLDEEEEDMKPQESTSSPQSVLDIFNLEDTAELRSSFHTL